jgi:hypothetical protein
MPPGGVPDDPGRRRPLDLLAASGDRRPGAGPSSDSGRRAVPPSPPLDEFADSRTRLDERKYGRDQDKVRCQGRLTAGCVGSMISLMRGLPCDMQGLADLRPGGAFFPAL